MSKRGVIEPVLWWAYSALAVTALCLGMYAVGQQVLRQSMDDIPVQLAENGAAKLNSGNVPASVVDRNEPLVDSAESISPWVAVTDKNGVVLESSATLGGQALTFPPGIFSNLDFWRHGHSWQPADGVREDIALVPSADGRYVVVGGQNMREMERHITNLGELMLLGWLVTLGVLFVASFVLWFLLRSLKHMA